MVVGFKLPSSFSCHFYESSLRAKDYSTNLMDLLPAIWIVHHSNSIGKGSISSPISVDDTFGSIGVADFFGAVYMMVFDLLVGEMIGLFTVLVGYLGSLMVMGKLETVGRR